MASADSDRVDLTELDVITRYSLAVRHGSAERSELIDALRADLAWLEGGRRTTSRSTGTRSTARKSTTRKTTSRRSR
jgi:hypothetical protein